MDRDGLSHSVKTHMLHRHSISSRIRRKHCDECDEMIEVSGILSLESPLCSTEPTHTRTAVRCHAV